MTQILLIVSRIITDANKCCTSMYIRLRPIMKVSTSNWPPQEIFSPDQVTVTDVPGDGNCMFYSLFRGDTNLENVRMVRKRLMDELISMRYE